MSKNQTVIAAADFGSSQVGLQNPLTISQRLAIGYPILLDTGGRNRYKSGDKTGILNLNPLVLVSLFLFEIIS